MERRLPEPLKRAWTEGLLPCAVFYAVIYDLSYYLFRRMLTGPSFRLFCLGQPVAFVCEALVWMGVALSRERWRSPLLLNCLWLIFTRLVLGESAFALCRWGALFVCFYHCHALLSRKQRDLLLSLVTGEMAVILALWALVGIGTALAGRPVAGMEGIGLATERAEDPLVYISFFGVHRNLTAACFVCAAGLLLYQCRRGSSRLWRALTAAYLPLAFCAVALQHSRSNYLALAVLMGLSLSYALGRLRRWPGGAAGRAAALGVLAVSVLVIYMGMGAVSDGMMALSRSLRENAPAPVAAAQEPADAAVGAEGSGKEADVMEIVDPRSTIEDLGTLSGRLTIWRAALQSLGEKPSIALIGQPEKTMMDRTNEINGTSHVHMHNILVQQLMLAGIPGLLLYCLFLGMVLKKLLPALFRYGGDSGARQAIAALLAALLIYGVFEPLLCSRTAAASLLFCLCAGRLEA